MAPPKIQENLSKEDMPQELLANKQSAYQLGRASHSEDVDKDIFQAMRLHLIEDLGISDGIATNRASLELARKIPSSVVRSLADAGITVRGKDVLDLGAGLGGMSEELVVCGARVTALEPGAAWASFTKRRVARHFGQFRLIDAFGESIPLPTDSVDLIVSLQVLEHVKEPDKVLAEAWRVLRPGGYFYLACENYLAFREGHLLAFMQIFKTGALDA